ncbi:MAG: porin [Luteolibacter sp.]|uniref:porin n=1 Tax=Luteolibacter sp. TaxID=1962973 RepID=UPI003263081B
MNTKPTSQSSKFGVPSSRLSSTAALAMLTALPMQSHAAEEKPTAAFAPEAFDQLWSLATLYKDDTNPILEEFKLRGRYQGQYWNVDADQGNQSNWEDRRSRFGFDAKLFEKQIEARVDFQSNDGFDDFYDGLVDAYIRWKPAKWISITAGKTKPLIGQYDWLESTNSEPTFERSQIFNQLGINRASALTVEGTTGDYSWRAGVYSNDTPSTTADPVTKVSSGAWGDGEFGDFDGGVSYSLGAGYDFKKILCLDKADVRLDWLHSDREPGDLVLGKYDDILSSTFTVKQGLAGVVVEGFYASGGDGTNSNVFGFYIEPTYDIIPHRLQLVGRYSFANSTGPLGVVGQSRYEKKVATGGGLGDSYNAIYGGVQYFIYGDRLKLMAGAEWSRLDGETGDAYDGITLLTGVRMSF